MNKPILTILIIAVSINSFCQDFDLHFCGHYPTLSFGFENDQCPSQLIIDTISNKNNVWQIGSPRKNILDHPVSAPNVIITDTANPYPLNDTSRFLVYLLANEGYTRPHTVGIGGSYYVRSDTITDYGIIEFSPDNGNNWIDLINDTIYCKHDCNSSNYKPVFTGNSNGWKSFNLSTGEIAGHFNIEVNDTVIYRFSFITDSINGITEGLMFDNLYFLDMWEGIDDPNYQTIKVYPNPVISILSVDVNQTNSKNYDINIYNVNGLKVYSETYSIQSKISINFSDFDSGIYCLELIDYVSKKRSVKRFMKLD